MKQKVYYYHDPVNDDFANTKIKTIQTPKDYRYINDSFFFHVLEYTLRPIFFFLLFLIVKVLDLQVVHNRKVIRKVKKQGYFIYGNHTSYMMDSLDAFLVPFPRFAHIIVNPDAVSIPGIKTLLKSLGVLPTPHPSLEGMTNFKKGIKHYIDKKRVIAIYPEAHIWPYYTDIRPFPKTSFTMPIELNTPVFAYTSVYKRRLLIKRPRAVTYVDGPFYPDESLPKVERIEKLRNDVYSAMKARVDSVSKYEYVKYVYVEDESLTNKKIVNK